VIYHSRYECNRQAASAFQVTQHNAATSSAGARCSNLQLRCYQAVAYQLCGTAWHMRGATAAPLLTHVCCWFRSWGDDLHLLRRDCRQHTQQLLEVLRVET
jgi:hypothetical protein